ncbi:3-octaprenyl-4hydroxybenzoate decarboxylase [Perkinsela sp. CCAP 1560/4]|nr:3-octaprenyl-4hydroxybenzoate decarboxylase [Perkinsela sp. CCAP 1560/4]|eukprot:KNH04614.1 3-octaprenyl-4hydroxybenzoate decarboxylase [Perkinsela sp. CCAP 1560/4]
MSAYRVYLRERFMRFPDANPMENVLIVNTPVSCAKWAFLDETSKDVYREKAKAISLDFFARYLSLTADHSDERSFLGRREHAFTRILDAHFASRAKPVGASLERELKVIAESWLSGKVQMGEVPRRVPYPRQGSLSIRCVGRAFRRVVTGAEVHRREIYGRFSTTELDLRGTFDLSFRAKEQWASLSREARAVYERKAIELTKELHEAIAVGIFPTTWEEAATPFICSFAFSRSNSRPNETSPVSVCTENMNRKLERAEGINVIRHIFRGEESSCLIGRIMEDNRLKIEFIRRFLPTIDFLYPDVNIERKIEILAILWSRYSSDRERFLAGRLWRGVAEVKRALGKKVRPVGIFVQKNALRLKSSLTGPTQIARRQQLAMIWAVLPVHVKRHYRTEAKKIWLRLQKRVSSPFIRRMSSAFKRKKISAQSAFIHDQLRKGVQFDDASSAIKAWNDLSVIEKLVYRQKANIQVRKYLKNVSSRTFTYHSSMAQSQRLDSYDDRTNICSPVLKGRNNKSTVFCSKHEINLDKYLGSCV